MKQEQMSELQKRNLDAAMRLAQLSIENSQRILQLQVDTARALFEDSVNNARSLTAAGDAQEQMTLRADLARTTTDRMLACARQIAEITTATQAEFGKLVSQQLTSGNQDVLESLQKMFSGMPIAQAGSMENIQAAVNSAQSAFEQVTKAAQDAFAQFTQMAGQAAEATTPPKKGARK
jgi:phasin family protein